ncbi:MAG TPA: PEP-CTERM sorting domain-containing protein, partial [Permianibacter sp.]|nr:PEP-CTERM sorting domain-containing protein [Permianibacter sp.]
WVHTFGTFVGDGAQNVTVTFIIADSGDAQLDSVAYISQLGGSEPPVEVPVPASLALFGLGLMALRARRK